MFFAVVVEAEKTDLRSSYAESAEDGGLHIWEECPNLAEVHFSRDANDFVYDPKQWPSFQLEIKPVLESMGFVVPENEFEMYGAFRVEKNTASKFLTRMSAKEIKDYITQRLQAMGWVEVTPQEVELAEFDYF